MARYSKTHKEETRRRILTEAARRFREDGLAAVGLRSLMTDAGLTHGGFYAHFESREALVAEAIGTSLEQALATLTRIAEDGGIEEIVRRYLDPKHRENTGNGCTAASLTAEIARESSRIRETFAEALAPIIQLMADQMPEGGTPEQRLARARAVFALLMGSLQLARAEPDTQISDAFLEVGCENTLRLIRMPWPED